MNKQDFLQKLKDSWYDPSIVSYSIDHIFNIPTDVKLNNDLQINEYLKTPEDIVHYYIILNSINHQFWEHSPKGEFIRYSFNNKVGAMALEAGMSKLVSDYKGIENLPVMTVEIFKKYFGDMPNPKTRVNILNEAISTQGAECAKSLVQKINDGWTIMEACDVAHAVPSGYKDEALKKAQLILHMASSALNKININVNVEITCFADYQVPRVLRHLGVLKYSDELAKIVDANVIIPADSKEEKAIRAATILACEELSEKMNMPPEELDYWLWSQRNNASKPFHLTYTTAY